MHLVKLDSEETNNSAVAKG